MKNWFLKTGLRFAVLTLTALVVFSACKKDEDEDDNGGNTGPIVLDGYYVVGAGTGLTTLVDAGQFQITRNEVYNGDYNDGNIAEDDRPELMDIFVAIKGGADGFNITMVAGSAQKTYGPGADFAKVEEADLDGEEPQMGLWKGSLEETATKFTVEDDALYHVMIDTEVMKVAIAKVEWGVIGGATPGGWGDNTPMPATFDLNEMTFEVAEVKLEEDAWKFRYSNGWKVFLDADYDHGDGNTGLVVNCNFGTDVSNLVSGGTDIVNDTRGIYKATMTWKLGEDHTATLEWVKDADPLPTFPEAMYLVGDGTAYGWDAPGGNADAIMHKIAGGGDNVGIYWKICHLAAATGFKVSNENWTAPNLGFAEVDEFDVDGVTVTVSDDGGNMTVADAGMYTIVLDLRNEMTKLSIKAAEVYGMGGAFPDNSWEDTDPAENMFTVDNTAKTFTSPALTADDNIRMYAQHAWIPNWWNAEFNVYSGVIEYRNDGGDQDAVAGTTGQVITLMFDDNTGDIQ